MSPEDKLAVKLNPHFAKDQKAMQELADRVGTETDVVSALVCLCLCLCRCVHKHLLCV